MPGRDESDSAREIVMTRLVDAPRALVWRVWTEAEHIGRWWGPRGFKTTTREMAVAPGAAWRFTMRGPDGTDYPNRIVYREVVAPERLVYDHDDDAGGDGFVVTVTFADEGGGTRVTMRSLFPTTAERERVIGFGAVELGRQTLDRLEEHVADEAAEGEPADVIITRVFAAPRELVYRAWTDAEHLARWWGPKGFDVAVKTLDLRPGGLFHYSMRAPNGALMWGRFQFESIEAPSRIVFVNAFSDEHGAITPNPWMPDWPLEVRNTLTLVEKDGRTTLTLRGGPLHATEAQRELFRNHRPSMRGGFAGTFAQLDEHLVAQRA